MRVFHLFHFSVQGKIFSLESFYFKLRKCELFVFLFQCSWPQLKENIPENGLKVAFLADIHLLGIRKGHWFDKLRRWYKSNIFQVLFRVLKLILMRVFYFREWQMHRSFQTMMVLHEPDIVFILGKKLYKRII